MTPRDPRERANDERPDPREHDLPSHALVRRARSTLTDGREHDAARRDLERALDLEPDRARPHRLLATWHLQHGSASAALVEARRAVALGSRRAGGIVLAAPYLMRGDLVATLDAMARVESARHDGPSLLLRLAVHAKRLPCWNVVEVALTDRLAQGERPRTLLALARVRARRHDLHGAFRLTELAVRSGLPRRSFLLERGDLALRIGDAESARRTYVDALAVPGLQREAWLHLERLFRHAGRSSAARRCLARARSLGHVGSILPDLELLPKDERVRSKHLERRRTTWERTLDSLRSFLPRFTYPG